MDILFAPMQGITDAPFRTVHAARFGGVTAYYMPFISPTQHDNLTNKELRDVSPEANAGLNAVPQVLTRDAEHFLFAANLLADLGWREVNLNMGCPAGTVTAKGKGAGMLCSLSQLELFLDEVFRLSPLPISIKTRLGWDAPEEFGEILNLLNRYPVKLLILHARTRKQFYGGSVDEEAFTIAEQTAKMPLVYNGDLFSPESCRRFAARHPQSPALMIGRGLAANPALARTFQGGSTLNRQELRDFHEELLEVYCERFQPHAALGRMRELGKNMICCFSGAAKPMKDIRKASSIEAYASAMRDLFENYPLRGDPGFLSDGSRAGHAIADSCGI